MDKELLSYTDFLDTLLESSLQQESTSDIKAILSEKNIISSWHYLIDSCGLSVSEVKSVIQQTLSQPKEQLMYWGKGLKTGVMILKLIENTNPKKHALEKLLLKFSAEKQPLNLIDFIKKASVKIQGKSVQSFVEDVQNDPLMKKIASILEEQHKDKNRHIYETLKAMEEDADEAEHCEVDRFLLEHMINSFKVKHSLKSEKKQENFQIEQFCDKLKKVIKQNNISIKIEETIKEIKTQPEKLYERLVSIWSMIHPINIPELNRLMIKSLEAVKTVKEKDLIIFLGSTGAGKTTILQSCLGYRHVKGKINGLDTLQVAGKMASEHSDFVTSPSSESCTKYIKAVELPENIRQLAQEEDQTYIADFPGFEDTKGAQVDAANSLVTIRALQECFSLRIVFVINEKGLGNRGEGMKRLIKTFSNLLQKFDRKTKQKIIFVLNNFTSDFLRQFPYFLQNLYENLTTIEKADSKFCDILLHLKKLTKEWKEANVNIYQNTKTNKQIIIFNPFQPDLKEMIRKITDPSMKVQEPYQYFKYNFSQKTRQNIVLQCENLKKYAKRNFAIKKFLQADYYVRSLDKLASMTGSQSEAAMAKINLLNSFNESHEEKYYNFVKKIKNYVNSWTLNEFMAQQVKELAYDLKQIQKFVKKIDSDSFTSSDKISQCIKDLQESILKKIQIGQDLKKIIQTCNLFADIFDENLKEKLTEKIKETWKSLELKIRGKIADCLYDDADDLLSQRNQLKRNLGNLFEQVDFTQIIKNKMEQVKNRIMQMSFFHRSGSKLFHYYNFITDNQINQIDKTVEELRIAWPKNACMKIIQSTFDEILRFLYSKVREILKIIVEFDQSENINSRKINIIVNSLRNAVKLVSISEIKEQMNEELQDSRKRLCYLLINKKPKFKKFNLQNNIEETQIQMLAIVEYIEIINNVIQVCEDQEEQKKLGELISELKDSLTQFLGSCNQSISTSKITLDNLKSGKFQKMLHCYRIYVETVLKKAQNNPQTEGNTSQMEGQIDKVIQGLIDKATQELEIVKNKDEEKIILKLSLFEKVVFMFEILSQEKTYFLSDGIKKKIQEFDQQFAKSLTNFFNELHLEICEKILFWNRNLDTQKIELKFVESQDVRLMKKRLRIKNRMKEKYRELEKYLEENNCLFIQSQFQEFLRQEIHNAKNLLDSHFDRALKDSKKTQSYYLAQIVKQLKALDEEIEKEVKFTFLYEEIKKQLDRIEQKYYKKPKEYISSKDINFYFVEQRYGYYLNLPNYEMNEKAKQIQSQIRNIFKEKQNRLRRKQIYEFQEIPEYVLAITEMIQLKGKVREIFGEKLSVIHENYEPLIKKALQAVEEKYDQLFNNLKDMNLEKNEELKKFKNIELRFIKSEEAEIKTIYEEFIEKDDKKIPFWKRIDEESKRLNNERKQILESNQNILQKNLCAKWNIFTIQDKIKIKKHIKGMIEKQCMKIELKQESIHELKKKIEKILQKVSEKIPYQIRQQVIKRIQETISTVTKMEHEH